MAIMVRASAGLLLLLCIFDLIVRPISSSTNTDDTCLIEVARFKNLVKKCTDAKTDRDVSTQLKRIEADISYLKEISQTKESVNNICLESINNAAISALTAEIRTLAAAVNEAKAEPSLKSNSTHCTSEGLNLTQLAITKSYHFSNSRKVQWFEAKAFCEKHKMHLASPETQEELEQLHQKAKQINNDSDWWLSASDVGQEPGNFEWHDGSSLVKYSPLWYQGEPNYFGQDKTTCIYIHTKYPAKLHEFDCRNAHYFVCEASDRCI